LVEAALMSAAAASWPTIPLALAPAPRAASATSVRSVGISLTAAALPAGPAAGTTENSIVSPSVLMN
jgi:hypothetical protein